MTPPNGRQLSETVYLRPDEQRCSENQSPPGGAGGAAAERGGRSLSVALTVSVAPPWRGPCILALAAGQFETCTMPENIEQLWGPVFLPSLPAGVPNTCIVASHRYDHCIPLFLVQTQVYAINWCELHQ